MRLFPTLSTRTRRRVGVAMNYVSILGTLTGDVELKYLPSGAPMSKFSIAYNESYKDQNGQLIQKTHFFNVTVFGKRAEVINQYFKKGSRILVQGSLVQDSWQAQDGSKRSAVSIRLENFDFIDRKKDSATNQPQSQQQYQPPQQQTQQAYRQSRSKQQTQLPEIPMDEEEIPF